MESDFDWTLHTGKRYAVRGWTRENAEGIPLDAPRRNYRDLNHKPELICALTPFTALKGFRPEDDLARRIEPIAGPELKSEVGRLGRERTPAALRALFTRLMTLEPEEKDAVIPRALAEAARQGNEDAAWEWVARLHARYPGDVGTLSPLYLNLVTLAPEEALFLSAGELHAYLEGTAIEIMANSDNVLRGGLTPKNVDVPELLGVLSGNVLEDTDRPHHIVLTLHRADAQPQYPIRLFLNKARSSLHTPDDPKHGRYKSDAAGRPRPNPPM